MTPRVRAKRILSHLERFVCVSDKRFEQLMLDYGLSVEQSMIGVYLNESSTAVDGILVTDDGIAHLKPTHMMVCPYRKVSEVTPLKNDGMDSEIGVILDNSRKVLFPILGRSGKFRDVFEFSRFLNRSCEDIAVSKASGCS